MRPQLKFVVRGLFGFLALAGLYGWSSKTAEITARAPASVELLKVTQPPGSFSLADAHTQAFHYHRSVQAKFNSKNISKSVADLEIDGTVWVSDLKETNTTRLLSIQFELKAGEGGELHESHLPFLVELTPEFKIKTLKSITPQNKSEEDEINLLKDFVSLYAYSSDTDTTGPYVFKLKNESHHLLKTKLHYTGERLKNVTVANSLHVGILDDGTDAPVRIEGKDEITANADHGSFLVTSSSYVIEKMTKDLPVKALKVSAWDQLQALDVVASSSDHLRPHSWTELAVELTGIKKLDHPARLSLFHELVKLMKAEPDKVATFREYLGTVAKEPGMLTFGVGVLATAGNDAAQSALCAMPATYPDTAHVVLNALATTDAALNPDTLKFLIENTDSYADREIARNAAFALGSALKKTNSEEARLKILDLYRNAKNETDRLSALDAMGNSGDVVFLASLQTSLKSDSVSEREKAAFALRFIRADLALPNLVKAFRDQASSVKLASIRALQFQDNLTPYASLIEECAAQGIADCTKLQSR